MRKANDILFLLMIVAACASAHAENFPSRPIRLIVPFAAGGAGDFVARPLSSRLGNALGQQFVIDNRPGAGGVIGADITAKASPDGYTLVMVATAHAVNPGLMARLPFDTVRDFAPITLVVESPLILVAHPSVQAAGVRELVSLAQSQPGRLTYGSAGPGTGGHLAMELLSRMAGVKLVHIPYKGAGPALIDLLGGQIQLVCTSPLPALPHVKSGKLKALAMTGNQRSPAAPDIPTVSESGLPGYYASLWYALLAPAATPREIIGRLHREAAKVLRAPDMRELMVSQGAEPVGNTPDELARFMQGEIDRWSKVIKEANIRVN